MSQRDLLSCWDLRCCILVGSASSIFFTDGLVAIAVAASSRSGSLRTGCLLQCWWFFVLAGGSHMKYRLVGVGYVCCADCVGDFNRLWLCWSFVWSYSTWVIVSTAKSSTAGIEGCSTEFAP